MIATEELREFEAEADGFLRAHATLRSAAGEWGVGSDEVSPFADQTPEEERRELRAAQAWRALEFDAGFGWIAGPTEHGGRGLPVEFQWAYQGVRSRYEVPTDKPLLLAVGMVGPTVLVHGQPSLRRKLLRPIFRGEIVACQLFSEPDAGSDLAAVRTTADRVDGGWTITGQKVWTSGAHLSDVGEILARSDPDAPKHRGITAFLIDMDSPGVEIRPLRQMTGGAHFNEVFLHDVFVPDERRLGDVNAGWSVATTTLMNERASLGAGGGDDQAQLVHRLIETARRRRSSTDPRTRQALAELYGHVTISKLTNERAIQNLRAGLDPGPELSAAKLARSESIARISAVASSVLGMSITADTGEWGTYAWARYLLGSPASRIAGGTDEIQRNIIAERVLGLPR